jgi:hypothetical protein
LVLFSFVTPERKLEKLTSKVWADLPIELEQLQIADSLTSELGEFYKVTSNGELLGYACYTSAFGCRVGGCAAPSNPNVQSYETFDYIVIYDTDLNVKKVDIANYGGQYGYEICRKKWLQQFEGKNSGFKLEDNIDGISGATVSAQFLIDDLNSVGSTLLDIDLHDLSSASN